MVETCSGGLELLCDSKKIHNVNVEFEQQNKEDKVVYDLKNYWSMIFFQHTSRIGIFIRFSSCFSVNHERIAFLGANQLD